MLRIAFDESGNTGQNLLDRTQPVFVLASVNLTTDEVCGIKDLGELGPADELKYSRLNRNGRGQRKLLTMLRSSELTTEKTAAAVYHRRYMVITKIVDMLVEELAMRDGVDLYERGANIALCNLWFYTLAELCGRDNFDKLLTSFVRAVRTGTPTEVNGFYQVVERMYRVCRDDDARSSLGMLLGTSAVAEDVFSHVDVTTLDPAVPTFVDLASHWTERCNEPFEVLHDASKPLAHAEELLSYFMATDEPEVIVGYDRRKRRFPLKATGIVFVDSKDEASVQIADLVSSATATFLAGVADPHRRNAFWHELRDLGLEKYVVCPIWPSPDVTPEALGTEEVGGINAADYAAEVIARQRARRRS